MSLDRVSVEEMQDHSEFDIDTDGTVSVEEAKVTQKHSCKIVSKYFLLLQNMCVFHFYVKVRFQLCTVITMIVFTLVRGRQ